MADAGRTAWGFGKGLAVQGRDAVGGAILGTATAAVKVGLVFHVDPRISRQARADIAQDVREAKSELSARLQLSGTAVANPKLLTGAVGELGPQALDAIAELGPEKSGAAVAEPTAVVVGTVAGAQAIPGLVRSAAKGAKAFFMEEGAAAPKAVPVPSSPPAVEPGRHGVNLLSPKPGGQPFELPTRPTWQASEADFSAQLNEFGFRDQVSFLRGQEVTYGTRSSSRPDSFAASSESLKLSVDVKNYDFTTSTGRSGALRDILGQVPARQGNLPAGTRQVIILDARGQVVSQTLMESLAARIAGKSGGAIRSDDIHIER